MDVCENTVTSDTSRVNYLSFVYNIEHRRYNVLQLNMKVSTFIIMGIWF